MLWIFFHFSKKVSVFQNFCVFLNFRILVIFYQITRKHVYFGVYMRLKSFFYLFLYHKKPIWALFFGLNKPQKFFKNFHFLKIGGKFLPIFRKISNLVQFSKNENFQKLSVVYLNQKIILKWVFYDTKISKKKISSAYIHQNRHIFL